MEQYRQVADKLLDYMAPDPYSKNGHSYDITSLYYDSVDYKTYWDKINGHKYRRKVRVRVYDTEQVTPDTLCFAEIKQRINKTLQKKRVQLPYASAEALCGAGQSVEGISEAEDQAIVEEIQYLYYTLQLQPSCMVSYNRVAFNGSPYDVGLRVTFDTNLKYRVHDLTLLSQGYAENHFFLPPDWCVMEVKVNYRLPYWLTELIGQHRCTLRRISKYCLALEQSRVLLQHQQIFY
jgi:SPX domain protein involved in polyphosphate accumulation